MSSSDDGVDALRARQAQWARFAEWEAETHRPRSLVADLQWLADATQLAQSLGAAEADSERLAEKVRHLALVRSRLAHLDRSRG